MVASAIEVSLYSSSTFNSSNTSRYSTLDLDEDRFIIAYSDGSTANMYAVVGELDGKSINLGTPVRFDNSAGTYVDIELLSEGNVIIVWSDAGSSNSGNSVVGTISGTDIKFGSSQQFDADKVSEPRVCALGSNSFTIVYTDGGNSSYGTVITGEVDNTTISYGQADVFESSASTSLDICQVDDNSYLIAYSANSDGNLIVGSASAGRNGFGTKEIYESSATAPYARVEQLGTRAFGCAYQDNASGNYGTIQLLTISGSVISLVSNHTFNKDNTDEIGLSTFDSGKLIVTYRDVNNNDYGTLRVVEYDGTTPTISSEYVYLEHYSQINSVSALNEYRFIVASTDNDNGSYAIVTNGIAPSAPDVSTDDASDILSTSAQLNGRLRDNGAATTVIYQYGSLATGILDLEVDQSPIAAESGISTIIQDVSGLEANTQHFARLVAWNVSGTTQGDIVRFTTLASSTSSTTFTDSDGDGVSDEDESGGPNNGDANNDGVSDFNQSYVVTLFSEYSNNYITIESLDCEIINDAKVISPTDTSIYFFPFGAIDFRVTCDESRIRVLYHGTNDLNGFIYRKKDAEDEWFDFNVNYSQENINGNQTAVAEFTLRDGEREDYDGEVNNVINDPGGPALENGAQIPVYDNPLLVLLSIILIIVVYRRSL